MENDKDG